MTAAVFGELPAAIGWLGVAGLATGGLLYVLGAVVYASGRPNPWPKVFGYHEIFHALVIAAAALQYAVIAFAVLPRLRTSELTCPWDRRADCNEATPGWGTSAPARIRGKRGCARDMCAGRGAAG